MEKARWQARPGWLAGQRIQPDPHDDGPDGFNHHDWDGDGDLDVIVNFEEGGYSRLYFNPGKKIRELWTDFIEFENMESARIRESGISMRMGSRLRSQRRACLLQPRKK